jgi:hypothetical protein
MNEEQSKHFSIKNDIILDANDNGAIDALDAIDEHIKEKGLDVLEEFIKDLRENIERNRNNRKQDLQEFANFFLAME